MNSSEWRSIPGVCEVTLVRGSSAGPLPDLLLEVPHGATRSAHFDALRSALVGDFPADLRDFFFVNTDAGAPELALRLAEEVVALDPSRCAAVLRCLLPRTFVDCNRVIDADARPQSSAAGEMTAGVHAWVTEPHDLELLLARYGAYRRLVETTSEHVLGAGGLALMVHSYAMHSIAVQVDQRIVDRLRAEYAPERIRVRPLRPEVDLICADPNGRMLANAALATGFERELGAIGVGVARNATYALHPVTLANRIATRFPGRTLCFEVRRDLLVEEWKPFAEMRADERKLERLARPMGRAIHSLPFAHSRP